MKKHNRDEMTTGIRLLWYFPSFELDGMYPGGFRTLALARALIRNGVSHVSIASITLKRCVKLSGNLELVALRRNPILIWKSLRSLIITRHLNIVQERLGCGYLWNGWGILAGRRFGIPTIGELHEYPIGLVSRVLTHPVYRYALAKSDKLFVINPIILDFLPEKVGLDKTIHIPNGYDDSILPYNPLKISLNSDPSIRNRKVVGYFGGLTKDKGVSIILDLIREMADDYFFLVAGRGPLEEEVKRLSRLLPEKCRYLGCLNQKEVYRTMALCDATLALYSPELRKSWPQYGNPLKVYESLAVGTPVVIYEPTLSMLPQEIADLCVVASEIELKGLFNKLDVACRRKAEKASMPAVVRKYSWDCIAKDILVPIYERLTTSSM